MRRFVLLLVYGALGLTALTAQTRADVALRAATELETVKGDVKGAIAAYQKIADDRSAARGLRAQALLRLAECYRKIGDAQARTVYERIVREFSDQLPAVASARQRLGVPPPTDDALSARRIYESGDPPDSISEDGTKLAMTDWSTGNIVVRDLRTSRTIPITAQPAPNGKYEEFGEIPILSRDGTQVAFTWFTIKEKATATAKAVGDGNLGVATIRDGAAGAVRIVQQGRWITAYDWSPDGKQIAAEVSNRDRTTSIVLISPADGTSRVLTSRPESDLAAMFFSPDGRSLAIERGRNVYVLNLADGTEKPVATEAAGERLAGWAAAGQILYTSDRNGTNDMYLVALSADGAVTGRSLLRSNVGELQSVLRLSPSGRFAYVLATGDVTRLQRWQIDLSRGELLGAMTSEDVGSAPSWSRDGSRLAMVLRPLAPAGRMTLRLRPSGGGPVVDLKPDMPTTLNAVSWGLDPNVVYTTVDNPAGRGLWSIDIRIGTATRLVPDARQGRVSSDGRHLEYFRGTNRQHALIERDIASGVERTLLTYEGPDLPEMARVSPDRRRIVYKLPDADAVAPLPKSRIMERDIESGRERELLRGRIGGMAPSPDFGHVAVRRAEPDGNAEAITLISTGATPEVRDLMRVDGTINFSVWAPDGNSVLVTKPKTAQAAAESWWVPVAGGAPRKLSQFVGFPAISPDGVSLASATNAAARRYEVWVMEHLLSRR